MELFPITLKDKDIFSEHLTGALRSLAGYCFGNNFIWRSHFELKKAVLNKRLCIFFQDRAGIFMGLPPLGGLDEKTIRACFDEMEAINHNKDISRIENVEESDLRFFKERGFKIYEKAKEYIVISGDVAGLRGEKLKHKRNLYNYFTKNNKAHLEDYCQKHREGALSLYKRWMNARAEKNSDRIYQAMLEDSFKAFSEMLENGAALEARAKVVESGGRVIAFTSGFPIHPKLFCINFEIADLDFKGLPQFVFTEFAKTLLVYPEINIMDDSGIENIRRTKLSYHPSRMVASYTAILR